MEFILEALLQGIGELALQLFFEALFEVGLHSLADTTRQPRHPVYSTIGFTLWGIMLGGFSLLIMPTSPIHNAGLRLINLIVTPMIVGLLMVAVGRRRRKMGQETTRLNRFSFAYAFALSFAAIRFAFAS